MAHVSWGDGGARGWLLGNDPGRRGALVDYRVSEIRSARDGSKAPPNGVTKNGKIFWWHIIFISDARREFPKSQSGEGGERYR